MRNPYHVLGVPTNARKEDIKTAYRALARQYHPDKNPGDRIVEDRFKEISSAYNILSSNDKRKKFDNGEIDANGNPVHRPPPPRNDPFGRFWRRTKPAAAKPVRGTNSTYVFKITIAEARSGVIKRISIANGKRLELKIPTGTEDGQILRLKGQGNPGQNGGEPGDALIEIEVLENPAFTIENGDVYGELTITLETAVLGGNVQVETLNGKVSMTVPAYAKAGSKLRIRGKGAAKEDGTTGDHYVILRLALPDPPDEELIAFYKKRVHGSAPPRRKKIKI